MRRRLSEVGRDPPSLQDYARRSSNTVAAATPNVARRGGALSPAFPEVQAPAIFSRLKKSDMRNHAHRFMQAFMDRTGLMYKTEDIFTDFEGIEDNISRERVQLKVFDQKMVQLLNDLDNDAPSFTAAERQKCLHPNARMSKRARMANSRLSAKEIIRRERDGMKLTGSKSGQKLKRRKKKKKKKKKNLESEAGPRSRLLGGRSDDAVSQLRRLSQTHHSTRRRTMADHFRHTKNRISKLM